MRKKFGISFPILFILLLISIIGSVAFGSVRIPIGETVNIILSKIPFLQRFADISNIDDANLFIVFNLRLPRIITAGLVGCALSVSGAAFQSIFKNPMAEPYIMGVSSGAAFGATLAIILGLEGYFMGFGIISLFAFVGALVVSFIVFNLGKIRGKISSIGILLSGVVVSSVLSSIVNLLMMINNDKLERIVFWTMGSFNGADFDKIKIVLLPLFLSLFILISFSKELNALSVGENEAMSMGVSVNFVKGMVLIISSLLAAISVSLSGIIGFVGLIIPHLLRLISGTDNRKLLPLSILGGAIFLILSDTFARSFLENQEIPVGIITSFFGGPFFLYLLRKSVKER